MGVVVEVGGRGGALVAALHLNLPGGVIVKILNLAAGTENGNDGTFGRPHRGRLCLSSVRTCGGAQVTEQRREGTLKGSVHKSTALRTKLYS